VSSEVDAILTSVLESLIKDDVYEGEELEEAEKELLEMKIELLGLGESDVTDVE